MSTSTPESPIHQPPEAHLEEDEQHEKSSRRVQWAPTDAGDAKELSVSQETAHLLDEYGLDPHAFRELHQKLRNPKFKAKEFEAHHLPRFSLSSNVSSTAQTPLTEESDFTWENDDETVSNGDLVEEQRLHTYVPPGERDGLPTIVEAHPDLDIETQKVKEAKHLVKQHRGGIFSYFSSSRTRRKTAKRPDAPNDDEKPQGDIEKTAQQQRAIPPLESSHTGVLASLLALYNTGNGRSGNSTPTTLVNESVPSSRSSGEASPHQSHDRHRHISLDGLSKLQLPPRKIHRPKTAKNGGGVVGSLIASTGNLSSVATPAGSTIVPNVKRPGYHLSRYSWEHRSVKRPKSVPKLKGLGGPLSMQPISAPVTPDRERDLQFQAETPSDKGEDSPLSNLHSDTKAFGNGQGSKRSSWLDTLSMGNMSLSHLPTGFHMHKPSQSGTATPATTDDEEAEKFEKYRELRKRKERRRKAEIFITRHVAQVMERQAFLLKLARALMMFGAPSHRLESQIQSTAHVLDLDNVSCLYLPSVMLISFGDMTTATSNIRFIKQGSSLDLGKLLATHNLYWNVIHDLISVCEAAQELDHLMRRRVLYSGWQIVGIGGLCSSFICFVSFSGSFIDSLISFPLGALLILCQLFSAKNELYSNVFEIAVATLLSFLSAALASSGKFCYTAVASSSVVLILPGFIVLCGSLELASRNIISGAVRTCYSLIYSLFLGFGLAMGAQVFSSLSSKSVFGSDNYTCSDAHHPDGPWWQRTPSEFWAFLCVPMYSLCLSMRNQSPLLKKEILVTILISCGGWAANHFAGLRFNNRSDITSAIGAFVVGTVANIYGRFFRGTAFIVMITGIMFQLPSGLGNGGLLTFASKSNTSETSTAYQAGFQVALQLVSVAIGLTVGLFASVVVVYPFGGGKKRAGGLFSL